MEPLVWRIILGEGILGFPVAYVRGKEKHFPCFVFQRVGCKFTMVTRGRPHRSEPEDTMLVDEVGKWLFKKVGWYRFLSKFSGENYGVARRFVETYNGGRVVIESLDFIVDRKFISKATGLPQIGKQWFKGKTVLAMHFNLFLKDEHANPDWKNGVLTHWLKEEWQGVIKVIQRYITCDFHLTRATVYLMRFLGHLVGVKELNLVNFPYKSLSRMSHKIQVNPSLKHWYVFHKGLIKILVSHQLRKLGKTWDEFLREEGFEGMNISRTRGRPPKNPLDSITTNKQPAKPRHFPKPNKFTFIGKRKA